METFKSFTSDKSIMTKAIVRGTGVTQNWGDLRGSFWRQYVVCVGTPEQLLPVGAEL